MWWKVLLCLVWTGGALAAGPGGGTSWLTDFGHNLRSELAEVLELPAVNYSKPIINATYVSRVEFDTRAMGHLYNSSKLAIDFIANKQAYPEGIVWVSDGNVEVGSPRENWRPLLAHYAGPASLALALLLFAVSMPVAGVLWCCCEWCGSRRRRPFDRKYDACVKGILAILLIALLTLFLFGVVCAFSTEEQLEDGLDSAPTTVRAGLRDGRTFLNATQAHARHLLVNNYNELKETLVWILNSSGRTISTALGEFSRARSVTTLHKMVQQLDAVHADLQTVHALTRELRSNADRLNSGLRRVKAQLLQTLATCDQPQCIKLQDKYKIGQLDTEIQYSQMPDVSELLNNVSLLLNSSIKQEVADGQRVFSNIQRGIERSVNEHIPSLRDAVTDTGVRLARVADEITWAAGNASVELSHQEEVADMMARTHARYGPYRRYAGLAAASALLLILTLMVWGLTCGVCGKRPDVYGASDCCNKGAGSKCLLCGMCMTFLLGGAVAAVIAVYFLLGVAATRAICDPLTEPRDNRLFGDLEKFVDLERVMFNERLEPDFNMTAVMVSCHANRTIYETFHLYRIYNLTAEQARIDGEVSRRVSALRPLYPAEARQITILKPSAKAKLQQLADTGLSDFNFDKILDALETNITSLSLEALVAQLRGAATQLQARPGFLDVSNSLRDAASMLEVYQREIVLAMLNHTHTLNSTALRLRDGLRFNHSSLKEAIAYLMQETSQAEAFLNTQGPQLVQNMTREFGEAMASPLQEYLQYVSHAASHDVGRCAPLSSAFNATRDAACQKLLLPVNGYWLSISWCLLVAIPMLVVAQRLARLYLHVDPYPGPLVEAEYLYDAYADRDNVPLANAYKAEKRSGRRETSGRSGAGAARGSAAGEGGSGAPVATAVDPHHARRYNDMAPKHWEEGPPRYHGPTEYERPPPYYYPGPHDDERQ